LYDFNRTNKDDSITIEVQNNQYSHNINTFKDLINCDCKEKEMLWEKKYSKKGHQYTITLERDSDTKLFTINFEITQDKQTVRFRIVENKKTPFSQQSLKNAVHLFDENFSFRYIDQMKSINFSQLGQLQIPSVA
jgi:hypothetical protein